MNAQGSARARKRPRRDEVRAGILGAAEAEFLRQGYSGANLGDISRRAGYTKGALYSNFESKAELFVSLIEERFDRVVSDHVVGIGSHAGSDLDPSPHVAILARRLSALTFQDEAWHVLIVELAILATHDPAAAAVYLRSREIVRQRIESTVEDLFGPAPEIDGVTRTELVSVMVILLVNVIALDGSIDRERFTPQLRTHLFEAALHGVIAERPGDGRPGGAAPSGRQPARQRHRAHPASGSDGLTVRVDLPAD